MSDKNIMLVCAAGMSTSLLVTKMQKSAKERGIDTEIFATGASEVDEHLAKREVNVLLLGPQVRFMKDQLAEKVKGKDIPVEIINMQDYGMINGEKVLQVSLDLME